MKLISVCITCIFLSSAIFAQTVNRGVRASWSIQEKQLNIEKRGVQLIWEQPEDADLSYVAIFRRAMDSRINADLTDVPWHPLVELSPAVHYYTDKSAQVSVHYQYKIVFKNTSGDESDPMIISVTVMNDNPPSTPKGFRVNGFDPMPPE